MVITIAAYNRPDLLELCLDAIMDSQTVSGIEPDVIVNVDGGHELSEVCAEVAEEAGAFVKLFPENVGINKNTFDLVTRAFDMDSEILYLEDDIILSADALELVRWYFAQDLTSIGALSLCNLNGEEGPVDEVYLSRRFIGWGFAMNRNQFDELARPIWVDGESMWDNRLANNIRARGKLNMFPYVGRSINIGRVGEHFSAEKHDKMLEGYKYYEGNKKHDFILSR